MDEALRATGLTKRYRDTVAVDAVDFGIRSNTVTGLLGGNGAGKTTLMGLITGQRFATAGRVEVFGESPVENDRVLSATCFVREGQRYPNGFRVRHVLATGRHFYPHWDQDLADRLVEDFGLPRKRQIRKLSRGMQSAVGIVMGLASRAPLTIFDEPYLGLDAAARQRFYDHLMADYVEHPRTVVLSSHLVDEISGLLEHVLLLDAGQVVLDAPSDDLRGTVTTLLGSAEHVEQLVGMRTVLRRESLGSLTSATVYGRLGEAGYQLAAGLGVEVQPAPLQQLVVHAAAIRRARSGTALDLMTQPLAHTDGVPR